MSADIDIKPSTAAVILVFFALLLGARFWAYGESVSVSGFSYLHTHPNGDTVALLNGTLYRFNDSDELTGRTELESLGVPPGQVSDFAWFSNGDLLIRQGRREDGLQVNLDRFQRKTNTSPESEANEDALLVRCERGTAKCSPFASKPLNLNDVFALDIDQATDRVFIADTSRHKVYLFTSDGMEIDRIDSGLRFPNQITFQDGTLYVANTNRHQVSAYRVDDKGFDDNASTISVTPDEAVSAGRKWPAAFLFLGNSLWVINATSSMDHGGIYLFDSSNDYEYNYQADEPDDADPVALVRHGVQVLVSDFSQDRIDVYTLDGTYTGEFLPDWLKTEVMQVREQRAFYRLLTDILTWLFILCLAGGFAYALFRQFRPEVGQISHAPDVVSTININDPAIRWIRPDRKTRRTLFLLPLLIIGLLIAVIVLRAVLDNVRPGLDLASLLAMAFFALLLFAGIYNSLGKQIGVLGDSLILKDRKGKYSIGTGSQILYSDAAILIGSHFVILGAQPKIFPTDQMMQYVYPVLKSAEFVSQSRMQRMLLRKSRAFLLVMVILFSALIGALVYFLRS